jgi:hypothetical protein
MEIWNMLDIFVRGRAARPGTADADGATEPDAPAK